MALGTITFGVNPDLEKKATRVLKHDRKVRGIKGVEALSEEYAWLTEQQLMLREDREIGNRLGYPDPEIVSGVQLGGRGKVASDPEARDAFVELAIRPLADRFPLRHR